MQKFVYKSACLLSSAIRFLDVLNCAAIPERNHSWQRLPQLADVRLYFIEDLQLRETDTLTGLVQTVLDLEKVAKKAVSGALMDGINYIYKGKQHSTLYMLLLEKVMHKAGEGPGLQADFPFQLLTLDVTMSLRPCQAKGTICPESDSLQEASPLLSPADRNSLLQLGGSARSMAVSATARSSRHHVYVAFGYPAIPDKSPFGGRGRQVSGLKRQAYPQLGSPGKTTTAMNTNFPLCQNNKIKNPKIKPFVAALEAITPPLILWVVNMKAKFATGNSMAVLGKDDALYRTARAVPTISSMHYWRFKGGKLVKRWNTKTNCVKFYQAVGKAHFLHAKAWDNVHIQASRNRYKPGVYLSFSSLYPDAVCYKAKVNQCDKANGLGTRCAFGKVMSKTCKDSKHQSANCKCNPEKVCYPVGSGPIVGNINVATDECNGIERLLFDGQTLQRYAVAFKLSRGDLDDTLYGVASDNLHYLHSNRTYIFVSTPKGLMRSIDVTDERLNTGAAPKDTLTPLVSQEFSKQLKTPTGITDVAKQWGSTGTPGTVVGALEGSVPVITTGSAYDVFAITSFQRIWRFDAMQQVPCGNLMKFSLPIMRSWAVPSNSTVSNRQEVELAAKMASSQAAPSPWTCELQKKRLTTFDQYELFKYVACCFPAIAALQPIACCVEKEGNVTNSSQHVQDALLAL